MPDVTYLTEDVLSVIAEVSREESARVFAERNWASRRRLSGDTPSSEWGLDTFTINDVTLPVGVAQLVPFDDTVNQGNSGRIAASQTGVLSATVPWVGVAICWVVYEVSYSSAPTFIEWSVSAGGFANDYTDFGWGVDDCWEHIPSGLGVLVNYNRFCQPIKLATPASGDLLLLATYDAGFASSITLAGGGVTFSGMPI